MRFKNLFNASSIHLYIFRWYLILRENRNNRLHVTLACAANTAQVHIFYIVFSKELLEYFKNIICSSRILARRRPDSNTHSCAELCSVQALYSMMSFLSNNFKWGRHDYS